MWEFSHSTEKACCTNRLHDWALPNKHAPGQSTHWSLSHSHAAAPEVPLWRCVNMSGENNPMAWNILDRWWSYVNVITSVYPFPIFQVMNCHWATIDLCNRARIPQAGGGGGALRCFPECLSHVRWVHTISFHVWEICWEISLALAPPGLYSQWCGEEHPVPRRWVIIRGVDYFNYSRSCGAELPVGLAGRLPGTLPV